MKRILDTSEILGTVDLPDGTVEVCATAEAGYEEATRKLIVRLTSFLRIPDISVQEKKLRAGWLPGDETITESVSFDDSHEVAKDIFHRWVRKVRQAVPSLHSPTV